MIFETKKGHKIEYKNEDELTAYEWSAMKKILAAKSKGSSVATMDATVSIEIEEAALRNLITAFDGVAEAPFEAMMKTLSAMEYEEAKDKISDVIIVLTKKLQT